MRIGFAVTVPDAYIGDGDGSVGQLLQFYGTRAFDGTLTKEQDRSVGVTYFDRHTEADRDAISNGIDSGASRVLIDLPPGSLQSLAAYDSEVGLLAYAFRKGFVIALANVTTPMLDSRRTVGKIIDTFQGRNGVKFLVAKNRFYGPEPDDFERYESGNGRRLLAARAVLKSTGRPCV